MKNSRDSAFSLCGLEVGLPGLQLPSFAKNVTHCRKEICSTSLSKGIQFLPEDWGRRERQHTPSALHDGCIMLAKDRVEVSKIWITGHWLWSRLSYIPDCWKSMKNCRDSAFSLRGLEAGLWAFRVQMLATCDDMLFSESIPAIPFWNSKPPLPTRSLRFLRAAVPSSNSALWLHHAHPFVAAAEKTCLMQRRGFGHGVVVWKICYNILILIVLSVVLCDCFKPTNNCWDWAFSNSEFEAGLPAFQLPMFAKCDTLPNGDVLDMFVSGIHSRHSFCEI